MTDPEVIRALYAYLNQGLAEGIFGLPKPRKGNAMKLSVAIEAHIPDEMSISEFKRRYAEAIDAVLDFDQQIDESVAATIEGARKNAVQSKGGSFETRVEFPEFDVIVTATP
jgi:hypothetical protein